MYDELKSYFDYSDDNFYDYLDNVEINLSRMNDEYKRLSNEEELILDRFPKLRNAIELNQYTPLTAEECLNVVKIMDLRRDKDLIFEKEIFYVGIKNAYELFKKIDAL